MKKRKKWCTESFIKACRQKHKNKYDYSKVVYKTMHTKVIVICHLHGEFLIEPNTHLKRGQECKKCAQIKRDFDQRDSTESFILKAVKKHGDKYNYSRTVYGKNAHEKVAIICSIHGQFLQSPNAHLANGGCFKCGQEKTVAILKRKGFHSWSKTNWKKRCKGKTPKFYIVEIFNEKERFFKVGITSQKSVKKRFSKLPYNYKILRVVVSDSPNYIFELERRFLKFTYNRKYLPEIKFEGYTECRINLLIH